MPIQAAISFLESYGSICHYKQYLVSTDESHASPLSPPPPGCHDHHHHFIIFSTQNHHHCRWEEEQVRRGATRPAAKPKRPLPSTSPWGGGTAIATVNGGATGAGWGGTAGERPRFLGIKEMQKALREAATQLRETHERNERQLQVVS